MVMWPGWAAGDVRAMVGESADRLVPTFELRSHLVHTIEELPRGKHEYMVQHLEDQDASQRPLRRESWNLGYCRVACGGRSMKQVSQSMKDGRIEVLDVPVPALRPQGALVRTAWSLISAGTEGANSALTRSRV